jgi:hypothetical protein
MSNKNVIRTLINAKKIYEERVADYLGDMTIISKRIDDEIGYATKSIIWASLGLEKSYYDGFKIASGSNRDKGLALVKFIEEKALESAKKWITDIVKGDFQPKLSKAGNRMIRSAYLSAYLERLKREITDHAINQAEEDAEMIVKVLAREELPLEKLMKSVLKTSPEIESSDCSKDSDDNKDSDGIYDNEEEIRDIERMFDIKRDPK